MATIRVDVSPEVLLWARDVGWGAESELTAFPKFDAWVTHDAKPTLNELTNFASRAGVPFGYMFLKEPPAWELPIPDFREGYDLAMGRPSADLMAVLNQSMNRQDWYREYAERNGLPEVAVVGVAKDWGPTETAEAMRRDLHFEVHQRTGDWGAVRKHLLTAFEELGGLTVTTSMVANNNKRPLDPKEFRGFALPDTLAPLIFVNASQTLNGQIFTIAHELAHIWRGRAGIGNEEPISDAQNVIERWCNTVASQILVPKEDLAVNWPKVHHLEIPTALDELARRYRCGTLVVLQALQRYQLEEFPNFAATYAAEESRLNKLAGKKTDSSGGNFYNSQPYRVGERLSRAIIGDAREGRTTYAEGMKLMSMRSATTFDEYARYLGGNH